MQIRHRIPTIFTLYMVDVLCCALGCVILLWQVNYHEATEQTAAARDANKTIAKIKADTNKQIAALKDSLKSSEYHAAKKYSDLEMRAAHEKADLLLAMKSAQDLSSKEIAKLLLLKEQSAKDITKLLADLAELKDQSAKDIAKLVLEKNLSAKEIAKLAQNLKELAEREAKGTVAAKMEKASLTEQIANLIGELKKSRSGEANAKVEIATLGKTVDFLKGELKASQAGETKIKLEVTDLRNKLDKANDFALLTRKDYDDAKKAITAAQKILDNIRGDFDKLKLEKERTTTELAIKMKEQEKLLKDLKGADLTITVLRRDLAARLQQHQNAVLVAEDLTKKLKESEATSKKLSETLASLQLLSKDYLAQMKTSDIRATILEKDLEKSKKDILEAAKRYQDLIALQEVVVKRLKVSDADLEEAKKAIANLQGDRLSLILQAKVLREAAENRFAGIPLTGQNVIFLIDMSGSMEMIDSKTLDPDKWPFLCDQVVKIMKSLPDLKQYQVILFSDKVRYPFGEKGKWLKYDSKTTPETVLKGLRAVKPKEETNMYDALEEAFSFREKKLDTIYMFSDGLPNAGRGLPSKTDGLTDQQQSEILARYIRARLKNVWNAPLRDQPKVRINTIGFFFESPDVGAFLWALAREHEGNFVGIR